MQGPALARQVALFIAAMRAAVTPVTGVVTLNIRPVKVTINTGLKRLKREMFYGAAYDTVYNDGPAEPALYLVGARPRARLRSDRVCFRPLGTEDDWHIALFHDPDHFVQNGYPMLPNIAEHQPFGRTFTLKPWKVPSGEAIDAHARTPYKRMQMRVRDLTPEIVTA